MGENYGTRVKVKDDIPKRPTKPEGPSLRGTECRSGSDCSVCSATIPRCHGHHGTSPACPEGERNNLAST